MMCVSELQYSLEIRSYESPEVVEAINAECLIGWFKIAVSFYFDINTQDKIWYVFIYLPSPTFVRMNIFNKKHKKIMYINIQNINLMYNQNAVSHAMLPVAEVWNDSEVTRWYNMYIYIYLYIYIYIYIVKIRGKYIYKY